MLLHPSAEQQVSSTHAFLKDYVHIARPDHWFKNIFKLPSMLFAFIVYQTPHILSQIRGWLLHNRVKIGVKG